MTAYIKQPYTQTPLYSDNGWINANEMIYSGADSPSFNVSISGDERNKYSKGMKLKLEQDEALTSYWSFDTDLTDGIIATGNDGTGIGGAVSGVGGKFNNGLTLNGTSQAVSIVDDATLKPTGDFTFRCWIKTSTTGEQIFQSYSENTNSAGFLLNTEATNFLRFLTGDNTGTAINSNFTILNGKTNVCDGSWHYVAVTIRNNWCQMYVDGVLDASGYMISPAYAGTNYVRIGCSNSSGTNGAWFTGTIDDISLINGYALDEETIKAKYDADTAQGTGDVTIQKKFLITDISYSAPNTTLTLYGGTDFALSNDTISNPYFSVVQQPSGFNRNPDKWSVTVEDKVDVSQGTPTQNVWYNLGSNLIEVPVGKWSLLYSASVEIYKTSAFAVATVTLSTENNSESDLGMTSVVSGFDANSSTTNKGKIIVLSEKDSFYLNARTVTASVSNMAFISSTSPIIIKAVSIYI